MNGSRQLKKTGEEMPRRRKIPKNINDVFYFNLDAQERQMVGKAVREILKNPEISKYKAHKVIFYRDPRTGEILIREPLSGE